MTRSNRILAAAAGLALASGAAVADPAYEVRYRDSFVERIDGYDVTYEYAGREYVTQLPYDPGERIRVRVDVTPADG